MFLVCKWNNIKLLIVNHVFIIVVVVVLVLVLAGGRGELENFERFSFHLIFMRCFLLNYEQWQTNNIL